MQLSSGYPINSQRIAIDNSTSEYLSDPRILPLQVFEVQNASLNCFTEFRVCKNGLVLPNVHFSASCAELFTKYQHQQLIKRHRKRVWKKRVVVQSQEILCPDWTWLKHSSGEKRFFQQWRFLPNLLSSRLALAKLDLPDWQTLANSSLVMKGQVGGK